MRSVALALVAVATTAVLAGQAARDGTAPAATATGQAVLAGKILSDAAGAARPVRRAVVTISGVGLNSERKTVTDDLGNFEIGGLQAGRYTVSVSKGGWITSYYGSAHPGRPAFGGATVALRAGQQLTTLTIHLLHGSAITGIIADPFGRPTSNVAVQLLHVRVQDGRRIMDGAQAARVSGTTDDRGVYRLFGVPPGDYLVVGSPTMEAGRSLAQLTPEDLQSARRAVQAGTGPTGSFGAPSAPTETAFSAALTVSYAPVYYPGTLDASSAVSVTVGANEERSGIDFALVLSHKARIQGALRGIDGRPTSGGQVQLLAASSLTSVSGMTRLIVGVADDGTFSFSGVTPGRYTLVGRAPDSLEASPAGNSSVSTRGQPSVVAGNPAPLLLWATDPLAVDGQDVTGIVLNLQRGATIIGHLAFDRTTLAPPTDLRGILLMLTPVSDESGAGTGGSIAQVDAAGALTFTNVPPGRYRASMLTNGGHDAASSDALKGWSVRSAIVGDRDALDQPFDVTLGALVPDLVVTLTDRSAEISGSVVDAAGHPVSDYRLVAFSADETLWGSTGRRLKPPVAADPDGTFRIEGLPAGEYFLAAVTEMDPDDLVDASFLASLAAQAIRITLVEGEKKVQNLRLSGGAGSPRTLPRASKRVQRRWPPSRNRVKSPDAKDPTTCDTCALGESSKGLLVATEKSGVSCLPIVSNGVQVGDGRRGSWVAGPSIVSSDP